MSENFVNRIIPIRSLTPYSGIDVNKLESTAIEIQPSTREELDNYLSTFYANEGENWQSFYEDGNLLGFGFFNLRDDNTLRLHVIEVIYEGNGTGARLLNWLFDTFHLTSIDGYSVRSSASYWKTLGAVKQDGYPLPQCTDEYAEDYEEWEGEFVLAREAFKAYCKERYHLED